MKILKTLMLTLFFGTLVTSCFEDLDDIRVESLEIKDFVWKGMNAVYLYKSKVK